MKLWHKLNGTNYRDWKFAVRFMLKGRDLWKSINQRAIYPIDENVKKCELHDKERDLAYSLIVQCIDK